MELGTIPQGLKEEIRKQLSILHEHDFMVMDIETNGLNVGSVLSLTAIKCTISEDVILIKDQFNRYYYPKSGEDYNQYSVKIHKLDEHSIKRLRSGCSYPYSFVEDIRNFSHFCDDVQTIVGYNVNYDINYVERALPYSYKVLDLMPICQNITYEYNKTKLDKRKSRLCDIAEYFGIGNGDSNFHTSLYDVMVTLKVLQTLVKQSNECKDNNITN